jgi:hypothetical protein
MTIKASQKLSPVSRAVLLCALIDHAQEVYKHDRKLALSMDSNGLSLARAVIFRFLNSRGRAR